MQNQQVSATEFLLNEAEGYVSRSDVLLAHGNRLSAGAVLGYDEAAATYSAFDPSASNGYEKPAAILLYAANTTANAMQVSAITGSAEVAGSMLSWGEASAIAVAVGTRMLTEAGIVVR